MGQTDQETLNELKHDLPSILGVEVEILHEVSAVVGLWNSELHGLPDREDGTTEFFADGTAAVKRKSIGLDLLLYYRLAIPGILLLHRDAQDVLGDWERSPCAYMYFAFQASDGRLVLSNSDTSILRVLSVA